MSFSEPSKERQERLAAVEKQLIQLFRRFKNDLNKKLGDKLTRHEFMFMNILYRNHPRKISALAKELNVTASHATAVAEKLVQKNWIKRERSAEDRRIIELSMTQNGNEIVEHTEQVRSDYLIDVFKNLTDDEIKLMQELLEKLQ